MRYSDDGRLIQESDVCIMNKLVLKRKKKESLESYIIKFIYFILYYGVYFSRVYFNLYHEIILF